MIDKPIVERAKRVVELSKINWLEL
jgi:hypothetical protein